MSYTTTHILYVAEFSTGGSVESLHCLVRGLDKQKYRVTVLFYRTPIDRIVDKFETAGAEVRSLYGRNDTGSNGTNIQKRNMQGRVRKLFGSGVERHYEAFKYALHFLRLRLPTYKLLKKAIFEIEPDLVHLNNGLRSDTPGMLAARAYGAPTFCHVRTFSKLTYLNIRAAHSVDRFICISNAVKQTIVNYGISEDRCVVVANAVDSETFLPSDRDLSELRLELGFDDSRFVFALVGRVVSWKGHDVFVEAIAKARESDQSIVGLIVGDAEPSSGNAEFMRKIRTRTIELGLEEYIRFAGHRTDVPDIMQAADAAVCPSSEPEPFGRVIIESMSVGTPVIATDAGGASDIINHGVNGELVAIKDNRALADSMIRFASDPPYMARLSSAGRNDAQDLYNVGFHVEEVTSIYRRHE